jgi:hypothetical protein
MKRLSSTFAIQVCDQPFGLTKSASETGLEAAGMTPTDAALLT